MKASDEKLSRLARRWTPRYPQLLTNIVVKEKKPLEGLDSVNSMVAQAEKDLRGEGRWPCPVLRYSGTEPKIRLLLEGRDANRLEQWNVKISTAIREELGG